MTAQMPITPTPLKNTPPLRPLKWGVGLLLVAVAAWFLWQWANDMSGVRREAPKVPTIIPLPPPPPPPPEKPKEPEPEVQEKVPEPEPTPTPDEVKPEEEAPPSPADDLANPMQIDGDAQSGNTASRGCRCARACQTRRSSSVSSRCCASSQPIRPTCWEANIASTDRVSE